MTRRIDEQGLYTQLLHAGQEPDPATGSRAMPIYQTTSYVFEDADHAERLFSLAQPGNIYSRIMNPTVDAFEKRMAILEDGVGALGTASGMAAITMTILNIAHSGDHIVASSQLYGGTYNLFAMTLPKYGIHVDFVDMTDPEAVKQAIQENTKAVYAETIGNPGLNVLDFHTISDIAHEAEIPLIVDSTFAPPAVCKPLQHGADIVIHSATKWIGGHGTSIGGVVIDGGRFEWNQKKFPHFHEPDPSYNGLVFHDLGDMAFILKLRVQILRDTGAALSPQNAFYFLQGLETLSLRMQRHQDNAMEIANRLQAHPAVTWVKYPGLSGHPSNELAKQYLTGGYGAVVNFGIEGGVDAGRSLIQHVSLWSHVANVGDAKSLIIHPASTTHQQLNQQARESSGVTDDLVRLSVGLENLEDLFADLDHALSQATGKEGPEIEKDLFEEAMRAAVIHTPEGPRRKLILSLSETTQSVKKFARRGYQIRQATSSEELTELKGTTVDYIYAAEGTEELLQEAVEKMQPYGVIHEGGSTFQLSMPPGTVSVLDKK